MSSTSESSVGQPNVSQPKVNMVSVKRYDVTVTWDQVLTSLGQVASAKPATTHPDVPPLLDKVSDLVGQLKDTVGKVNQLDPTVLQRKVPPPAPKPQ